MKTYRTQGTCSRAINYEVQDGIVTACEIVGGCPGNTRGVSKLVIGRKVEDVIAMLKGIPCRNGTSCPDQLARALDHLARFGAREIPRAEYLQMLSAALVEKT